ncbi:hypothetical protein O0L34_g2210 [Tuta absoluta]|nr:hypothetical protein O0L34_g2210 [Tuta absoluta]
MATFTSVSEDFFLRMPLVVIFTVWEASRAGAACSVAAFTASATPPPPPPRPPERPTSLQAALKILATTALTVAVLMGQDLAKINACLRPCFLTTCYGFP